MKMIDIDDLPPDDLLARGRSNPYDDGLLNKYRARSINRIFTPFYGSESGPGIDCNKLLDWRSLERRYACVKERGESIRKTFFDTCKKLSQNHIYDVWLLQDDGERAHVYREGYLGSEPVQELINRSTNDPDKKACVPTGEERSSLLRLLERDRTYSRRAGLWRFAFEQSVTARLVPFLKRELLYKESRWHFYKDAIFLIRNDDRQYVVASNDRGMISFNYATHVFQTPHASR